MGGQGTPGGGDSRSDGLAAGALRIYLGGSQETYDPEQSIWVLESQRQESEGTPRLSHLHGSPESPVLPLLFPHLLDLYLLIKSISSIPTFSVFATFPRGL